MSDMGQMFAGSSLLAVTAEWCEHLGINLEAF